MQFYKNIWSENSENLYLQNIQQLIWSLTKYLKIKEIIYNLKTIIFYPLQNDKLITKRINLKIVKEKLIVVATNSLVCYIFFKVYLYLYIKLI